MHVTWHPRNQTEHPLSWHVSIVLHQTVLCIRQLVKHCLEITLRHINVLNNSVSHLSQVPGIVFNLSHLPVCFGRCWFNKYAASFCLVWQSETCADQLEDILGFQPISTNLSRKLSRWSRQFDQQSGSQCAFLMQHPRCSAPSVSVFTRRDSLKVIFQKFTSMDTMSLKVSA